MSSVEIYIACRWTNNTFSSISIFFTTSNSRALALKWKIENWAAKYFKTIPSFNSVIVRKVRFYILPGALEGVECPFTCGSCTSLLILVAWFGVETWLVLVEDSSWVTENYFKRQQQESSSLPCELKLFSYLSNENAINRGFVLILNHSVLHP